MGEEKKDTKAKEKSDAINNKIKWPFVIFFAIAIFVAISIVARVYQDKFNDLYTPALYLFSTIAQTMGALLGIGLALLYTAVTNMKPNINMPALQPSRRILFKDDLVINAVKYGLLSISLSVIGLFLILIFPDASVSFYPFIAFIGLIAIILSITTIFNIITFAWSRYKLYFLPLELVKDITNITTSFKLVDKDVALEIFEVCIMLGAIGITNKIIDDYIKLFSDNLNLDIKDIYKLEARISDDVFSIGNTSQIDELYFNCLLFMTKYVLNLVILNNENYIMLLVAQLALCKRYIKNQRNFRNNSQLCRQILIHLGNHKHINEHWVFDNDTQTTIANIVFGWLKSIYKFTNVFLVVNNLDFQSSLIRHVGACVHNLRDGMDKQYPYNLIQKNYTYVYVYDLLLHIDLLFRFTEDNDYADLLLHDEFTNINFSLSNTLKYRCGVDYAYIHNLRCLPYYPPVTIFTFYFNIKPIVTDEIKSFSKTYGFFLPIEELRYMYAIINRYYYTHIDFVNEIVKKYCSTTGLDFENVVIGINMRHQDEFVRKEIASSVNKLYNDIVDR